MKTKFAGVIAGALLANGPQSILAEDLVATRNISVGSMIGAADIATPRSPDAMRRASHLIGREAARTIYKGYPLHEDDTRTPTLIERNAIVQMAFSNGPLTINAEGRALDQGGLGDRIRVMNLASKRVITVHVVGRNSVKPAS